MKRRRHSRALVGLMGALVARRVFCSLDGFATGFKPCNAKMAGRNTRRKLEAPTHKQVHSNS